MTSCRNLKQMACLCRHMWFIQDGATMHDANIVLDFLDNVFGPRIMSNCYPDHHNCSNFWPPLSPDLNPGDFNLWYSLKEKLFPQKPSNNWDMRNACWVVHRNWGRHVPLCYYGQVSSTSSNSKKLWPHWAHADTKKFTQMYAQNVWRM